LPDARQIVHSLFYKEAITAGRTKPGRPFEFGFLVDGGQIGQARGMIDLVPKQFLIFNQLRKDG
jgi:hypothetical protein